MADDLSTGVSIYFTFLDSHLDQVFRRTSFTKLFPLKIKLRQIGNFDIFELFVIQSFSVGAIELKKLIMAIFKGLGCQFFDSCVRQIIMKHYSIEIIRIYHQDSLSVRATFRTLREIDGRSILSAQFVWKFETTGSVIA